MSQAPYAQYSVFAPIDLKTYPQNYLLETTNSPQSILAIRKELKKININGIIVSGLATEWYRAPSDLDAEYWNCRWLNWHFKDTYLAIRFVPEDKQLPDWESAPTWNNAENSIVDLALWAKKAGFKGVVLDLTAYEPMFWNPEYNDRYKTISDDYAGQVLYQRGRELIQKLETRWPNIPIIIQPIGTMYAPEPGMVYPQYAYWIHFVNGLLSTKHAPIFFAATMDAQTTQNNRADLVSLNETLPAQLDEKQYLIHKPFHRIIITPRNENNLLNMLFITQQNAQNKIILNYNEPLEGIIKQTNNFNLLYHPQVKASFYPRGMPRYLYYLSTLQAKIKGVL